MKNSALILLATVSLVSASAATADGIYVMAGVGQVFSSDNQSKTDASLSSAGATGFSSSSSKPTVYKLQLGYRVNTNFAVEGGYLDSNNDAYSASGGNLPGAVGASSKVGGWNLSAVGILPVAGQFSLLGKLGVAYLRTSGDVTGVVGSPPLRGTRTDLTYGAGVQYDFTKSVFGRLDVDSYKIGNSNTTSRNNVWMVDVGLRF